MLLSVILKRVGQSQFSVRVSYVFVGEYRVYNRAVGIVAKAYGVFRSVGKNYLAVARRNGCGNEFNGYNQIVFDDNTVCVFTYYFESFLTRLERIERVGVYGKRSVCERARSKFFAVESNRSYFGKSGIDFRRLTDSHIVSRNGVFKERNGKPFDARNRHYRIRHLIGSGYTDNATDRFCVYFAIFKRVRFLRIVTPPRETEKRIEIGSRVYFYAYIL